MPNFKRIGGGPWKSPDDLTWNDPSANGLISNNKAELPWIVGINVEFGVVVRENIYYVHIQDVVDHKLTLPFSKK